MHGCRGRNAITEGIIQQGLDLKSARDCTAECDSRHDDSGQDNEVEIEVG